jgi:hypothetical protein
VFVATTLPLPMTSLSQSIKVITAQEVSFGAIR